VTLTSPDGSVEVSGTLLGFDGDFYRVDTVYGELTVDGSGVTCAGPGCPDLQNYVARLSISGSATIGDVLMPALIEGFALRQGFKATHAMVAITAPGHPVDEISPANLAAVFAGRIKNWKDIGGPDAPVKKFR